MGATVLAVAPWGKGFTGVCYGGFDGRDVCGGGMRGAAGVGGAPIQKTFADADGEEDRLDL